MTQLAKFEGNQPPPQRPRTAIAEIKEIANEIAESRLYPGIKTAAQAFVLMMLCEADGLLPIEAVRRYHMMDTGPSMRADTILATFQSKGGRVKWVEASTEVCEAQFSHPVNHPEPVTVRMTLKRFVDCGLATSWKDGKSFLKTNWKNFPDAMLKARVSSAGVRMVMPGVVVGIYTPEEMDDIDSNRQQTTMIDMTPGLNAIQPSRENTPLENALAASTEVIGQAPGVINDERNYLQVATDACSEANRTTYRQAEKKADARDLHRNLVLAAVTAGHYNEELPKTVADAIRVMGRLYKTHRQWTRETINALMSPPEPAESDIIDVEFQEADDVHHFDETAPMAEAEAERTPPWNNPGYVPTSPGNVEPDKTRPPVAPPGKTKTEAPYVQPWNNQPKTIDKFIADAIEHAQSEFRQNFPNQVRAASFKLLASTGIQVQRHLGKFGHAKEWCTYDPGVTLKNLQSLVEMMDEEHGPALRSETTRYIGEKLGIATAQATKEKAASTDADPEA